MNRVPISSVEDPEGAISESWQILEEADEANFVIYLSVVSRADRTLTTRQTNLEFWS